MARNYLIFIVLAALVSTMIGGVLSTTPGAKMPPRQISALPDRPFDEVGSADVSDTESGAVELERSADGHFYADVEINGASVRALIDTGASAIALSRDDALSAAVPTSIGMPNVVGRGADGEVFGEEVMLDRVALGHQKAENMPAIVLNAGDQTLLGQSFLSKFGSVEIRGDKMVLR